MHDIVIFLVHTWKSPIPYTVYTTLDYEYRHENKGTDLVLVPRSMGCINETVKLQDVYSTD